MLPRLLLAVLLSIAATAAASASTVAAERGHLRLAEFESGRYPRSVDFSAYAPATGATAPSRRFEGRLRLSGTPASRMLLADAAFLVPGALRAARTLPPVELAFTQDGAAVLPLRRQPITSVHAHWEWLFAPGRAWDEAGDAGHTRVAIPFALVEKNANCTHNGMLMLLLGDDGVLARAAFQVGSETCQYLWLDLWGFLDAGFVPGPVDGAVEAVAAYRTEVIARLPVQPLATLANDHPGLDPIAFAIGDAAARTLHGVVVDDVHYRGDCATRHGTYPDCDALLLPSFSIAKSVVAGIALMRMEQIHPGLAQAPVSAWIPASGCRHEDWADVRFIDLLDMASGHYNSPRYMADEGAADATAFFAAGSHARKLAHACESYPRHDRPGERWVYHSSDSYLLGTALRGYLRRQRGGGDVFADIIVGDVFAPLGLSSTIRFSRRSDDAAAQPFFGWGLFLHGDDLVRLARFLGPERGRIGAAAVLDPRLLDEAMQRVPASRGLPAAHLASYRYQHGVWARDLQQELGCMAPAWVPFLSGFGGITVAILPNGVIWYGIADDGALASIDFAGPAREAAKLGRVCPPGG